MYQKPLEARVEPVVEPVKGLDITNVKPRERVKESDLNGGFPTEVSKGDLYEFLYYKTRVELLDLVIPTARDMLGKAPVERMIAIAQSITAYEAEAKEFVIKRDTKHIAITKDYKMDPAKDSFNDQGQITRGKPAGT